MSPRGSSRYLNRALIEANACDEPQRKLKVPSHSLNRALTEP
jgi:hypothetical protein